MARSTKTASGSHSAADLRFAGAYSVRFSGFGLGPQGEGFYVAGVGQLQLDIAGALTGNLYSSLCPMTTGLPGTPAQAFLTEVYQLGGTYNIGGDGTGTVSIDFMQGGAIQETDVFRVVPGDAAMTRFWMISTQPTQQGAIVPELVSGEAVRLY